MLKIEEYVSPRPDHPYTNFAHLVDFIANKYTDKDFILYRSGKQREFTRWSFTRFYEECKRVARGLLAAGLVKGDRVALWAENRPEWMSVWMGTVIAGIYIVPIDFLTTETECLNIIKITKAKAFFYSGKKKSFAGSLASNGVSLSVSVCISNEHEDNHDETEYDKFGRNAGSQVLPPIDSIDPNHPCSIVFTSGTTGFAKGVTLSHKNIIANASGAIRMLDPTPDDIFMDVLPLHHTYPTTCSFIAPLSCGLSTVIAEKIVGKVVVDDICDGKVTFLIAVPLLYDKVMAAIDAKYQKLSPILRGPLNILRTIALKEAKKGNPEFGRKALRIIRKKANLQSINIMVAGGGALSIKTADFFDSLGFNIVHGYGMSENSPLITVNTPHHKRNESVGLPISYTDLKIINPGPDGIGEIACKSPSIMLGYYENEEATKEVITEDGWLLTGDLGYQDSDGYLHIKGRQKNLIVGSGGKNIYPEEVEANFAGSRSILEILVVGRNTKGGEIIFGVMVPNYEFIKLDHPGKENDDAFIFDLIKKEVEEVNRSQPVYKKIGDFCIRKEAFEKNAQQKIRRFMYKSYENP
ncbi:MAG: AMP-binding protein [Treponema sp.]|nr:AMP-binding protein [Treponema sp.]MCL2251295.1 AMP-binding protein [Treponema sp.]